MKQPFEPPLRSLLPRRYQLKKDIKRVQKSGLFDEKYYVDMYPDVERSKIDPLTHYMTYGWKEKRNPSATFDTAMYMELHPDVIKRGLCPLLHHIQHGNEGTAHTVGTLIANSSLFDEDWYVKTYHIPKEKSAIAHYLKKGWKLGYSPSCMFDGVRYLKCYCDIQQAGIPPLVHWVRHGQYEQPQRFYFETSPPPPNVLYPTSYRRNPGQNILLVSHQLDHTGAPILLLEVAKMLKEMGFNPFIMSPISGDLEANILGDGIPVIIWKDCRIYDAEPKLPVDFSFCICNTILSWGAYRIFSPKIPTIWWIHDNVEPQYIVGELKKTLQKASCLYVPSQRTKESLIKYNSSVDILPYPIKDQIIELSYSYPIERKLRISVMGSICKRKAQDIFIEAISKLPEKVRRNARFEILGYYSEKDDFCQNVKKNAERYPEIALIPPILNKEQYHRYIDTIDVLCCPSREDPFPLVVIDALMHGKICLVSDHVGESEIISHGMNGYVVESENSHSLARVLEQLIENKSNLRNQQEASRQLFIDSFSYEKCRLCINNIITQTCSPLQL